MTARIYQPSKTAMQSGKAKTKRWILVYEPEESRTIDPLMGYVSSSDMNGQIQLYFDSKEDAVSYARRNAIPFQVQNTNERKIFGASYSDNFKFDRKIPWTH